MDMSEEHSVRGEADHRRGSDNGQEQGANYPINTNFRRRIGNMRGYTNAGRPMVKKVRNDSRGKNHGAPHLFGSEGSEYACTGGLLDKRGPSGGIELGDGSRHLRNVIFTKEGSE